MRLLIIEDEAPMRTALVETLKAEGYRVLSAIDGPSGLELACTEPFDLGLIYFNDDAVLVDRVVAYRR